MDMTEFNNILNNLLKKIYQEQKEVFLLGDFNTVLMHCNEHNTPGMRRGSDISLRSHIGLDVADHAKTSS